MTTNREARDALLRMAEGYEDEARARKRGRSPIPLISKTLAR